MDLGLPIQIRRFGVVCQFSVSLRFNFSLVAKGLEMVLHLPFNLLGVVTS